jgi:hypothetical protein
MKLVTTILVTIVADQENDRRVEEFYAEVNEKAIGFARL